MSATRRVDRGRCIGQRPEREHGSQVGDRRRGKAFGGGLSPTPPSALPSFLPLALRTTAAPLPADEIRIELQRGATAIKVTWPATAAADCAVWLRELLR
jgi:hypothetical protein